jgi:hypothetical protein
LVKWLRRESTPSITDAHPPADEQLRHRRRVYTVIMAIHIIGFAVGGSLYSRAWLAGLIIIIVTGPLQWIAVLLANAAPKIYRRTQPAPDPSAAGSAGRAIESAERDRAGSPARHRSVSVSVSGSGPPGAPRRPGRRRGVRLSHHGRE